MNIKKELWEYKLQFTSHVYWENKMKFELNNDTYFSWVLFAVESGSFQYQINNEKGVVNQNELVFCPPYCTFYRNASSSMAIHFITFNFDIPLIEETRQKQMSTFKVSLTDKIRLMSNFSYLQKLNLAFDTRSFFRKQWILNDLWLLACNEWDAIPKEDDLAGFSQTEDKLMNSAMNVLISKATTQFNISELSKYIGLSQVQFTRRFQKAYDTSPSEALRIIRIKIAAKLLLDSNMTVEKIARESGYDNGFYLSRVFKKTMGVSPSVFRQTNKI